ncbi:hypothetical protein F5Y03DRAFT_225392 [Xylaria venustula]|nr:hypothetical protein F5Y03DRAFT_225392 [Xylaria venustula]
MPVRAVCGVLYVVPPAIVVLSQIPNATLAGMFIGSLSVQGTYSGSYTYDVPQQVSRHEYWFLLLSAADVCSVVIGAGGTWVIGWISHLLRTSQASSLCGMFCVS